jgi:hypothetical protein
MVHFPPFASSHLCIQWVIPGFCPGGFPHSPKLIAACHVLHRLFLPRHPPCALSSLTIEFTRTQQSINLYHISRIVVSVCVLLSTFAGTKPLSEEPFGPPLTLYTNILKTLNN